MLTNTCSSHSLIIMILLNILYMNIGFIKLFCLIQQTEQCDGVERTVTALQDYTPLRDHDLPLKKKQDYTLISSANADWWSVQDEMG